jgi:hypothetical protein
MSIEKIRFGRIFSHLLSMVDAITDLVKAKNFNERDWSRVIGTVSGDKVYIGISSRQFRSPVTPESGPLKMLSDAVQILDKTTAGNDFPEKYRLSARNIVSNLGSFVRSHSIKVWSESDSFITIPVIAETGDGRRSGMVFLKTTARGLGSSASSLDIGSLTRDRKLLSAADDYFGTIAALLLKTLYFVQYYPFNQYDGIVDASYRLCFDCQITEGRSMGAAVLALFAVTYMRSVLGEISSSTISPRCGTVITGEIDDNGTILQVEDFNEKIRCVYEELGPRAKLIIPRGQPLPQGVHFDEGNVFPVGNAEELLAAVFSSHENPRALDEARAALFKRLAPEQKRLLISVLIVGMHTSVFDQISQGGGARLNPRVKQGGIYRISKAFQDLIEMRLALEPDGVLDRSDGERPQKELIQVILDGSASMDYFWIANKGISRLTSVLFEIAKRVDPQREELMLGFLSHDRFYELQVERPAVEIEAMIQGIREENNLRKRGAFFRFSYEGSLKSHGAQLKRVYVISNSKIPDEHDLSDINVSSFVRFYLTPRDWSGAEDLILFPNTEKDAHLDKEVLAGCFHRQAGKITELSICFDNELPLHWLPYTGNLTREDDRYRLTWKNLDELSIKIAIGMAGERPHELQVAAKIRRKSEVDYTFNEYPTVCGIQADFETRQGNLSDAEFDLWKTICSPGRECPICGNPEMHLSHMKPRTVFSFESVFQGISRLDLRDGFLLHQEGSRQWAFFRTGYGAGDVRLVLCDGRLHYSTAKGKLDALREENGFYSLSAAHARYHIMKC